MAKGTRKDCVDLAPKIRRAFTRAIKRGGDGNYLATLMQRSLEKDFVATLNAVSKFNPKTSNVNQTNTLEIKVDSSVTSWIDGFQAGSKAVEDKQAPALEHLETVTLPETLPIEVCETVLQPVSEVIEVEEYPSKGSEV